MIAFADRRLSAYPKKRTFKQGDEEEPLECQWQVVKKKIPIRLLITCVDQVVFGWLLRHTSWNKLPTGEFAIRLYWERRSPYFYLGEKYRVYNRPTLLNCIRLGWLWLIHDYSRCTE